jgi:DNA polymerase III, delta prime subunit
LVRCTPPTREQGIAYLKSQKVRNPEGELTRLSGRPLLIHEADPNLTLDKKDEAKYLEMLALGSALSSVQVLSAFQKDMPVGPVVSVMQRWYWDLMAVLSGAEPRYFPEHAEAYKRQAQGTDFQKLVPFNQTLMQANCSKDHPLSKRLVLQDLFITWAKTLADARKN